MIRLLGAMSVAGLVAAAAMDVAGPADELSKGIQQVKDGNFDGGLLTLDGVVSSLAASSDPKDVHDRAQAHLYLGVAYVGLLQETPARKHFREALKLDPSLRLEPTQYSARVVRVFEAARTDSRKPVLYAGAGVLGLGAVIGGAAVLLGGAAAVSSGIVLIPSDITTTTTTTLPFPGQTPTPGPAPTRFTKVGQSNAHTFAQSTAGPTTATVFGPPGGDLGVTLCRGVATALSNCNFAAVGGGGGTQTVTAVLPAGTNTLIVQAVAFPPGEDAVQYAFQIRTP
jgi:hypothetical protein